MATFFIYACDLSWRAQPAVDAQLLKSIAPTRRFYVGDEEYINEIAGLINDKEIERKAMVIEIEHEAEAVAFKMMQAEFVSTCQKGNIPRLKYILEDPDWKAILAEGRLIEGMIEEQEKRKEHILRVNATMRQFNKFDLPMKANVELLGEQATFDYCEFATKLEEHVENFRAANKEETAKLAKERAKVRKKLQSYNTYKAK
jgi:hypothetical protein